jgi:hypothetical protein
MYNSGAMSGWIMQYERDLMKVVPQSQQNSLTNVSGCYESLAQAIVHTSVAVKGSTIPWHGGVGF